jgi:hypothetical protein
MDWLLLLFILYFIATPFVHPDVRHWYNPNYIEPIRGEEGEGVDVFAWTLHGLTKD